ncbi:hypothetical protein PV327_008148 [Microctonus hyperodae]|uniref:BTB domain-containing protein n=1 Tax=Microctonus hyperodae TaxID=165561 RepID=A0AA39F2H8_MICHY|nr:hypothetical protein PV327_008148 [Microctonus hyperodae]
MAQPDLQINHSWEFEYNETHPYPCLNLYSASFFDKSLPDVKFSIFCGPSDYDTCKVIISKTPCRPANATCPSCSSNDDIYITCTFRCCITWGGFNGPQQSSINHDLYSGLKNFLTASDLSDVMIVIDEKEILLHKIILAAYSPVFSAMIKSDITESSNKRIVLTDIEVEIMENVIEFMYTGTINPVPEYDVLFSIMKAADKYKILGLKEFCERKLSEKITLENVFEILETNSLYGCPLLAKSVIDFMIKNKTTIIGSKDFNDFCRRKPELLSQFFIHSVTGSKANK